MRNQGGSSQPAIMEYPFDYDRYIKERLREIGDLDERRFAKEILLDGLGRVIRCMEQKYQKLEQRVYDEVETAANQYGIVTTIVQRKHYDPTNGTLFPVDERDLDGKMLSEDLSEDNRVFLGTTFLEADEETQKEFCARVCFPGIRNQKKEDFFIEQTRRYQEAVERLYQVFQDNHVPWETMNTGYLDKFYDVYAEKESRLDREGEEPDSLENVEIWYGKFASAVRYGRIPLWNLEKIFFDKTDFMMPCMDGIYYEHEFSLEGKEERDGYLIRANEEILEIRHEPDRILIKSGTEIFVNWEALHLVQKKTQRSLDYEAPLLTNRRKDSFVRRYAEKNGSCLMTRLDLFRRIMELDIQDYVEVVDYEISEAGRDYPKEKGMNWFVPEEVIPMERRRLLLLKFEEKQRGNYLNGSMVRFAVSQIQREIHEYCCVGVIV